MVPEIGVITEQNDMGLGFNPLNESEVASLNSNDEKSEKKRKKTKKKEEATE
jgi:hypothetical protein